MYKIKAIEDAVLEEIDKFIQNLNDRIDNKPAN